MTIKTTKAAPAKKAVPAKKASVAAKKAPVKAKTTVTTAKAPKIATAAQAKKALQSKPATEGQVKKILTEQVKTAAVKKTKVATPIPTPTPLPDKEEVKAVTLVAKPTIIPANRSFAARLSAASEQAAQDPMSFMHPQGSLNEPTPNPFPVAVAKVDNTKPALTAKDLFSATPTAKPRIVVSAVQIPDISKLIKK